MSSKQRLEKAVRREGEALGLKDIDISSLVEYIKLLYEVKQEIEMAKRQKEEGDAS